MKALQETNPEQAAFYLALCDKAKETYVKDDYVSVCSEEHLNDSWESMCQHMDVEMVRLGFEFGRMYERLGVVV
jgi:hypothetical protein